MGGRKKIRTVSVLLASAAASALNISSSFAADLTITDARTTPVDTTTGDGTGPGNITISSTGSLSVTADSAATINSSNSVSLAGAVTNAKESNATGVLALTTKNGVANNITGSISNLSSINVTGPATSSTLITTDVFNAGIKVSGLGTFTGNIVNDYKVDTTTSLASSGSISVGGHASSGILVQSNLVGSVTNRGAITVYGNHSYGIATTGRITGSLLADGNIYVGSTDNVGVYVGGGIDGTATISGGITAGTGAILTSPDGIKVTTIDATPAKAGVWVASDITQGLTVTGNRMTRAEESADPTAAGLATPIDANIAVVGGPAVLIMQGGLNTTLSNITIGAGAEGYAFRNAGNILEDATVKGLAASAITIQGASSGGTNYATTLTGGLWNDKGNIETTGQDAQAVAVRIGNYGIVPRIQNDGDIFASAIDSSTNPLTGAAGTKGGDAYGVLIDPLGSVSTFTNTGRIIVTAQGQASNVYGVIDKSGTLTSFTNTGFMNNVLQLGGTGKITGVDLRANTSGITFSNTGTIVGEVYLGAGNSSVSIVGKDASVTGGITFQAGATKSGNNTLTVNAGTVFGLMDVGNGTHTVTLTNGANAKGGLAQGTGALTFSMDASQVRFLSGHPINASSATITGASTVTFDIDNSAASLPNGILQSAGTVSIGAASKIVGEFTGLIDGQKAITVIRAGTLALGAPLSQIATSPNSFINSSSFSISPTNPNTLLLNVRRKSAAELGLGPNGAAVYDNFTTALNQDVPLVTAISAIQTAADFTAGLRQLMPDSSGALQQASLNNQDMASGAIRRRLVGVARNGMPDHAAGDVSSFWAQALGDFSNQKAHGEQAGFDVWGLGIAVGADMPTFDNTTNLGISFTETWHSTNLKVSLHSPVQFYNTQVNLYGRYSGDALYIQASGGGGYNTYNQRRKVIIGDVTRTAVGKWKGYEYGGEVEVGYATRFSAYELTPFVRGAYLKTRENGYTETGGGTGIDLTVGDRNPENARASAGFTLDRDFPIYYDSYVEAEIRGNFTREFMNDPYGVTAQFAVGPSFTNFSTERSPNRANVGVGVAHKDSYSSVSVDYDAEISKGYLAHKVAVTARFRF